MSSANLRGKISSRETRNRAVPLPSAAETFPERKKVRQYKRYNALSWTDKRVFVRGPAPETDLLRPACDLHVSSLTLINRK